MKNEEDIGKDAIRKGNSLAKASARWSVIGTVIGIVAQRLTSSNINLLRTESVSLDQMTSDLDQSTGIVSANSTHLASTGRVGGIGGGR